MTERVNKQAVIAKLKETLPPDRAGTIKAAEAWIDAINVGDPKEAARAMADFERQIPSEKEEEEGGSVWVKCRSRCRHHMAAGDPVAYGACYWGCVGGV